jgi:hypothetical protein
VLVTGVPYVGPYNVNSIMNPILAMCMGLGYFFNMYRGRPLVRHGGVMILFHPLEREFHAVHHPSYIDFFDQVLAETTDPALIEQKYEEAYATDPWYVHLYRSSHAYHGVHPFYMWYWGAHGMDHCGDVIWVGADRAAAHGWASGPPRRSTDALEMASTRSGATRRSPTCTPRRSRSRRCADAARCHRGAQEARRTSPATGAGGADVRCRRPSVADTPQRRPTGSSRPAGHGPGAASPATGCRPGSSRRCSVAAADHVEGRERVAEAAAGRSSSPRTTRRTSTPRWC